MRIGIDIDDTLTNIKDELDDAAFKYACSLGKKIDERTININSGNYQKAYGFSYKELKYFLKNIQENITNNASPRKNVSKILKKLSMKDNEIIIITARDSEFHDDPYTQSKEWLENNDIYYDKLIVNARDKRKVCEEESIDIFIDDNLNNCLNVSSLGIDVIRISDLKDTDEKIKTFDNWLDIYDYIINKY